MATVGTVSVNVVANTGGYSRGLKKAATETQRFDATVKTSTRGMAAFAAQIGLLTIAYTQLSKAISSAIKFQDEMNKSLAIQSNITPQIRGEMEDLALEMAQKYGVASEELAKGFFFLASAGQTAEQQIASLETVTRFAVAGQFDMATATDLLTDAQSALGLTSENTAQNLRTLTRVSDVLVKANTLANASVQQFSESLTNQAAAAARIVGKDIEEVTAVLAVFADQGIKGAEAGTKFGIVMRDLQTKAIKNAGAFRELGISVFDTNGNINNLADIISDIENRLSGMSDATAKQTLLTLGFADKSVAAIQALIGMSDKIRKYEKALRSASGVTKEVAEKQMQSAAAQIRRVEEAFKALFVEAAPVIQDLAEGMLAVVQAIKNTLAPLKLLIGLWEEFRAIAGGPEIGASDVLIPGIKLINEFGKLFKAGEAAGAGEGIQVITSNVEKLTEALNKANKAQDELTEKQLAKRRKQEEAIAKEGENLAKSLRTPLEILEDKLKDIERLLAFGAINLETFTRAQAAAFTEADQALRSLLKTQADSAGGPGAALARGSAGAFSAIQKARREGAAKDQAKRLDKLIKEAVQGNEIAQKQLEAMVRRGQVQPINLRP